MQSPDPRSTQDITDDAMGSALPSLLLYAAKQRSPEFNHIRLEDCWFGLSRESFSPTVELSVHASAITQSPDGASSSTELIHREELDLASDDPLLLCDEFLSPTQVGLLRSLAKIPNSEVDETLFSDLKVLPVELLPAHEASDLFSRPGKYHVFGQMRIEDGSLLAIDCFQYNREYSVAVSGCTVSGPRSFQAARTPFEINGYVIQFSGLPKPILVQGMTQRQAQQMLECLVNHVSDFGIERTVEYSMQILDHVLHNPALLIGAPVRAKDPSIVPLGVSLAQVEESLRRPGIHTFHGYIPIDGTRDTVCYADIAYWRGGSQTPSAKSTSASDDSVLLRAVSRISSGTFEHPCSEPHTTGYVLEVGPERNIFDLDDMPRDHAMRLFRRTVVKYRRAGLRAALKSLDDAFHPEVDDSTSPEDNHDDDD